MGEQVLIFEQYSEALIKYPKLGTPRHYNGYWQIEGTFDVIDDEGGYWDSYEVSIILPQDYPNELPLLIEKGEKIKRHIDWHISEGGICCLSTSAKIYQVLGQKIRLLDWLNQFAHPYLANHVYRIKTGNYAHAEYSHGAKGILEGWQDILLRQSSSEIMQYLRFLAGYTELPRNRPCFCGSGKKFKRCFLLHREAHRFFIPVAQICSDIKALKKKGY
jgi:hypothetical protein